MHGYHLVKGKSKHPMEDCLAAEYRQVGEHNLGLFAIFDGHLGHTVADFLRSHLFDNILSELVVANVGDSRAVISKNGLAKQLSVDHEPNKERQSIEEKGGFVSNIPGDVPRVDGQLAVARAFGDRSLKKHLSSDPDVVEEAIDKNTEFLILASDGLWKVMSNQEAVDEIKDLKDAQAAAKHLTELAVNRKSKDDISCIVVKFFC
ncbi:hypothetical protein GUJ93_ZPchr0007g4495 [Zizania palustris]|uniref:PPM-type phosphatase domain-containing protein n=1 Tax=Zizania palustris TaxID=103762 RepID=A0A8J5W557_ZIZPA|nr:hypothetical protein GUJ93_ZPchr0007g4495 [Zizania palustris]